MLFMLALNILLGACLVILTRTLQTIFADGGDVIPAKSVAIRRASLRFVLFFVIAAMGVAGFFAPLASSRTNYGPLLFAAFGLSASLVFFHFARKIARDRRAARSHGISFRFGACVLIVAAGAYMIFACLDHYWFLRGDPKRIGVVYAGIHGLTDGLNLCNDDILVRLEPDTAEYRCPRIFAFGRHTDAPFIPWPYDSGSSVELAERMARLQAEASGL